MGRQISEIVTGIGMLIALYLILVNYKGLTQIIRYTGNYAAKSIKTLQGR